MYSPADLIVSDDGRIYHLNIRPEQLADTVITVADPARVEKISCHFDRLEFKQQHREFMVHTGYLGKQRLTVLSTGIGTDNIDIVLNELDALVNIDFVTRQAKESLRQLKIIRLGTCGALQAEIALDSFVLTDTAIGFDNLLHFYDAGAKVNQKVQQAVAVQCANEQSYVVDGNVALIELMAAQAHVGMTATMPGFYGPQGRALRLPLADPNFMQRLTDFRYAGKAVASFDMETAGIYALGNLLGHACCSIAVVVAQRQQQQFTASVEKAVEKLIAYVLERI